MGSSRARVKSRLRYGMYSRIVGTGAVSASAGSQIRAARRHPSDIGIQEFSITRTACGNRRMFFTTFLWWTLYLCRGLRRILRRVFAGCKIFESATEKDGG